MLLRCSEDHPLVGMAAQTGVRGIHATEFRYEMEALACDLDRKAVDGS